MKVCRPGYFAQKDKNGIVRVWNWAGQKVVAVIDIYTRKVIWAEEGIEVQILCEDIHIKTSKPLPAK